VRERHYLLKSDTYPHLVLKVDLNTYFKQTHNIMKKYTKIEFLAGESIESAIKTLNSYKQKGELACGEFNGHKLYSDKDDLDSAFKKVTGKTKSECDADEKKRHEEYEEQKRKHQESIPDLTKEWIEKGSKVLDRKYMKLWKKCVPVRLSDLYQGMELGCCLDIVEKLNEGCDMDTAKEIIEGQSHSGMSFSLVCSMVESFCDRGEEFVKFVR
jgi:hypothetical protein